MAPQPGQRSLRVQFGYLVETRREILAGGRSPVSILLITSCETFTLGQDLLRQGRPGPVIAKLRAEHARRRASTIGIVRHLIGILSGKATSRRQSVGIQTDPVPKVTLAVQAVKHK
jgi:hypothetical protein